MYTSSRCSSSQVTSSSVFRLYARFAQFQYLLMIHDMETDMEQSEEYHHGDGPYFSGTRFHRLQSLPGSIIGHRPPGGGVQDSQDEVLLRNRNGNSDSNYSTTSPEVSDPDRKSHASLRPVSLFHGSRRVSPIERPSCMPRQREAPGRSRAMTSPSVSASRTTNGSVWESISQDSSHRSRSLDILTLFPMVNTQPRSGGLRRKSTIVDLSVFSNFSGAHYQAQEQVPPIPVIEKNQPIRHASSIRIVIPEVDISDIYRPLERDVDPRISRPFRPQASSARSYGPADIRIINVPPPNTPNPEYQMHHVQSQRAIPVDGSPLNSPVEEYLARHDTFPTSTRSYGVSPDLHVGFWHKSMAPTRKSAFSKFGRTILILLVFIYLIILMGTGILSGAEQRLSLIPVAIVDFDTPSVLNTYPSVVGPYIREGFEAEFSNNKHLGYQFPSPAVFRNDAAKVYEAVYNNEYWAAVIIHANATNNLIESALMNDTSYNPRLAATIVVNEARHFQTYEAYITPTLNQLALSISAAFEPVWLSSLSNGLLPNSSFPITSQTMSPGISFSFVDIRSVAPSTTFTITTVNMIYLVLISFYSCTFFMHTHILFIIRQPALNFSSLVIYRWFATMTAYFFFAFVYSLVALTAQAPFSTPSRHIDPTGIVYETQGTSLNPVGAFFTYLALNFLGTAALGLVSENMAMFLSLASSLPYSLLFLLFWMASNICTSFYSLDLASPFYQWGYAWPMHNIVEGTKTLILGVRSDLAMNFGVLAGWVVLGTTVFPLACWLMKWKGDRTMEKCAESDSNSITIGFGRDSPYSDV